MAETKGYVYLVKEIGIRYFLRDAIHQGVSLDESSVTLVKKMMAIFSALEKNLSYLLVKTTS